MTTPTHQVPDELREQIRQLHHKYGRKVDADFMNDLMAIMRTHTAKAVEEFEQKQQLICGNASDSLYLTFKGGCRKELSIKDCYRCTGCGGRFHKECILEHFELEKEHDWGRQQERKKILKEGIKINGIAKLYTQFELDKAVEEAHKEQEQISLCAECNCMTKTVGRFANCGKCGAQKYFTQSELNKAVEEAEKRFDERRVDEFKAILDWPTDILKPYIEKRIEQLTNPKEPTTNKEQPHDR